MRSYIHSLKERHPRDKRRISMQASVAITAVVFIAWVATLGVRLTSDITQGTGGGNSASSLVAATEEAGGAIQNQFTQLQGAYQSAQSSGNTSAASSSQPAAVLNTTDIQDGAVNSTDTSNSAASYTDYSGTQTGQ